MDGRALVDSKNVIIIFVYLLRRRHRTFSVCARVRALYFSNTPAARHAVIACAMYFVFFSFLLCAVFFSLQRLPATLRAEARRRACLPACCVRLLRARAAAAALFRLLLLLLVLPLPLLVGAAAAASIKFCVQPTAAAFPLLLPARGQAFAGAGFSPEGAAAYARKKPSWYVAARFCALTLCFGAYARVCALYERAPFTFSIFIFSRRSAHNTRSTRTRTLSHAVAVSVSVRLPLPTVTFV